MGSEILKHKDKRAQETQGATYEFFKHHSADLEKIGELCFIWQDLFDLIPQYVDHIFSGHTFPITEASLDAEYSRQLCFMGFYKHSFLALRGALELGLLSVAWNFDDNANINIQKWVRSQEDTPRRKEIIKRILLVENVKNFFAQINVESEIEALYLILSNFVHTKGVGYSSYQHNRANFAQFQEKSLLRWIRLFERVTKVVCAVHLLKYPVGLQYTPVEQKFGMNGPAGGFLEPHEVDRIKKIFTTEELRLMQKISDEDPNAKTMAEWINNHPDITEEEFEQQVVDFDKSSIKMEGWTSWSSRELEEIERLKLNNSEFYNKYLEKYELIESWARENNLILDVE